jgi:hypothetical protein
MGRSQPAGSRQRGREQGDHRDRGPLVVGGGGVQDDHHADDGSAASSSSSSSSQGVPRGAVGYRPQERRGGWEGEHLEREREREVDQDGAAAPSSRAAVAVDLEQFRNYRVGEGYQARHVVRQRTAAPARHGAAGAGASGATETADSDKRPSGRERRVAGDRQGKTPDGTPDELDRYLECEAFRTFRRELDKILGGG